MPVLVTGFGRRFWPPVLAADFAILVTNFGCQFWSPILAADFGPDFAATSTAIALLTFRIGIYCTFLGLFLGS